MDIYSILQSKPHNPHYLSRYYKFILACKEANVNLIRRTKKTPNGAYMEEHHIGPKAKDLFPEYSSFIDYPWNKIDLSSRQHFIAHMILWRVYGGSQTQSFRKMCNETRKRFPDFKNFKMSRLYEILTLENHAYLSLPKTDEHKKNMSKGTKGLKMWTNGLVCIKSRECPGDGWRRGVTDIQKANQKGKGKGRKYSPERNDKLSKSLMGHPSSPETNAKIAKGHIGLKASIETTQLMSIVRLGRKWFNDGINQFLIFPEDALEHYILGKLIKQRFITNGLVNKLILVTDPLETGFRYGRTG